MESIEDYQPRGTEVVATDDGHLEIFFDQPLPEPGDAVALDSPDGETLYAVVRRHLGSNRLRATMPQVPDWIAPGTPVSTPDVRAGLRLDGGRLRLTPSALVPETDDENWFPIDWRDPDFAEVTADLAPLETGWNGLDTVAPLVAGGLNLVIDRSGSDEPFARIAERMADALASSDAVCVVSAPGSDAPDWADVTVEAPSSPYGGVFALRAAVALAADRRDRGRDVLVIGELPPVGRTVTSESEMNTTPGYGELIDRIGAGLTSTDDGRLTGLLRLPIPSTRSDIAPIIETLDLGDVEAQAFIDTDGRLDPDRSATDAPLEGDWRKRRNDALATLRRADKARDKARIFGETELSNDEKDAIERANALRDALG